MTSHSWLRTLCCVVLHHVTEICVCAHCAVWKISFTTDIIIVDIVISSMSGVEEGRVEDLPRVYEGCYCTKTTSGWYMYYGDCVATYYEYYEAFCD